MEFEKKREILNKKEDKKQIQKRNVIALMAIALFAVTSTVAQMSAGPKAMFTAEQETIENENSSMAVDYDKNNLIIIRENNTTQSTVSAKEMKIKSKNRYVSKYNKLYEQEEKDEASLGTSAEVSEKPEESSKPSEQTEESKTAAVTETSETIEETESYSEEYIDNDTETSATYCYTTDGSHLNSQNGVFDGPSGLETYYNLPMDGVVSIMRNIGFDETNYPYWVRDDGCKMLGDYIMVAADLSIRPRGSTVPTSLGTGLVCDTGGFIYNNPYQLDIAVVW